MTNDLSARPSPSKPAGFPKSARILRSTDFRRVYDTGFRVAGPFFAAFCLAAEDRDGPKVGFTTPRALGKAVIRNRLKRRLRDVVRRRLNLLEPQWRVVFNPRRAALNAPLADLEREVERVFERCKR